MDDGHELRGTRSDGGTQFDQSLSLVALEEDSLLGYPPSEYLVLGLEQFDFATQFVLGTPCQIEQNGENQLVMRCRFLSQKCKKMAVTNFLYLGNQQVVDRLALPKCQSMPTLVNP